MDEFGFRGRGRQSLFKFDPEGRLAGAGVPTGLDQSLECRSFLLEASVEKANEARQISS
jgi:hypothetical protein